MTETLVGTYFGRLDGANEYTNACRSSYHQGGSMKKKNTAKVATALAEAKPLEARARFRFVWHLEKDRRDPDNIAFAQKYIFDALQEVGVIKNDSAKEIAAIAHEFEMDGPERVDIYAETVQ